MSEPTASRWCAIHDQAAAECWSAECLNPARRETETDPRAEERS